MDILANGSVYLIAKKNQNLFFPLDNGHEYVSNIRHDLNIIEVAPEDVTELLNKRCGCCDAYYQCFRGTATAEEVALWKSPITD